MTAGSWNAPRRRRPSGTRGAFFVPGTRNERNAHEWTARRDDRPARRSVPGPDHEGTRRADLPDDVVRVRRHPARRRPVRAQGAGQHLHAHHEPDVGRVRAARHGARGRPRCLRDGLRPGRRGLLRAQRHARRRQHHLGLDAVRRHVQPVRAHAAAVRHRGALGRPRRPRRRRPARRRQDAPRVRRDDRQPEAQRRRHRAPGPTRRMPRACR